MDPLDWARLDPVARALINVTTDWIVILDRAGTVLDASPPVLAGLGIHRSELLGRLIGTILAPGQPPFDAAVAADGSAVLDRELAGLGGARRSARLFLAAADSATVALRIEFEPSATNLKRAELSEGEATFRALAESMPAALFLLDPWDQDVPLRIMYANAWASKIYGYTNDEFVGRSVIRLLDTPASAERATVYAEKIMQGEPVMFDAEQRHRDGKVLTIEVIAMLVPWGSTKAVLGLASDVTERRAAERALQALDQQYRLLADSILDIILLIGSDGHFLYVSPSCFRFTGYTPAELLAGSPLDILHPDDQPAAQAALAAGFRGEPVRFEGRVRCRDGSYIWMEAVANRATHGDENLPALACCVRDVSERRALEEQLRHSQKMEAVGRLAGGVSHDFNNLLTAITGYAERALRKLDPEAQLRTDLDQLLKAVERAATLTRQLLVFSRHENAAPQILATNAVVSDMVTLVRRTIGEDIELRVTLDPSVGAVNIDKGYLEQIMLNLCLNARDAMPRGGRLTIETANAEAGVNTSGSRFDIKAGRYVRLAISDTGCGMSPDTLSHLFDPFFTTKPVDKGTGLGLSTVYGIVTGAGGHIEVESEPDRGASFRVYLPSIEAPAAASPADAAPLKPLAQGETILLVEDNDLVRDVARVVLEIEGYTVVVAAEGSEALTICADATRRIDLIVTDVIMPGMSGPELVERLASLRPGLKVLYISGYSRGDTVPSSGFHSGNYLKKPFTAELLARKVREVLDITV